VSSDYLKAGVKSPLRPRSDSLSFPIQRAPKVFSLLLFTWGAPGPQLASQLESKGLGSWASSSFFERELGPPGLPA